jgi:hypothetical protein
VSAYIKEIFSSTMLKYHVFFHRRAQVRDYTARQRPMLTTVPQQVFWSDAFHEGNRCRDRTSIFSRLSLPQRYINFRSETFPASNPGRILARKSTPRERQSTRLLKPKVTLRVQWIVSPVTRIASSVRLLVIIPSRQRVSAKPFAVLSYPHGCYR